MDVQQQESAASYAAATVTAAGPAAATGSVDANAITVSANGDCRPVQHDDRPDRRHQRERQANFLAGGALTALDNAATPIDRATSVSP